MNRWLPGFLVAGFLSGCTMIPQYHRPPSAVSASWPKGAAYGAVEQSGNGAEIAWKSFYRDPLLQSLIVDALQNNRDLQIAALQIRASSAQSDIENASLFPTLTGDAGGVVSKMNSRIYGVMPQNEAFYTRGYGVGFGVSAYEVDLWGRIRSASRAAFARYMGDVYLRQSAEISLKASLATAYLNWVANNQGYLLTRDVLENWQHTYDIVQASAHTGTATALDVAQSEEAVREAEKALQVYERQTAQALNQIELLVGKPLSEQQKKMLSEKRGLVDVLDFPNLPAGLPSELLNRRPDILAAEQQLRAANDDIGAARANFFPKIQITAANGTASRNIKNLFRSGMGAWDVAPQITLPLFDAGRLTAELKQAKTEKKIEIAHYQKSVQTAFQEVADALAGRETYLHQETAQSLLIQATNREYRLSQARFREGVEPYQSTLLAQRVLLSAQLEGISVELARRSNLITLYKALGGGWVEPDVHRPFKIEDHLL